MSVAQMFVLAGLVPGEAAEKPQGSADCALRYRDWGPQKSCWASKRAVLFYEAGRRRKKRQMSVAQMFLLAGLLPDEAGEKPQGSADSALRYRGSEIQKSRSTPNGGPARGLREIGVIVSKAVLEKNIDALLAYDRADLRSHDEASLKNTQSDLYCYIFDTECITWGDGTWRSVYDKLSQARQLEIRVSVFSSRYDRQTYGNLFFYDGSAVSVKDLRSADFLCKEAPANIASWKFRLENGKWKPVNPLFDSETRACPSAPEEDVK